MILGMDWEMCSTHAIHGKFFREQAAGMHLRCRQRAVDGYVVRCTCGALSAVTKLVIGPGCRHGVLSWTRFRRIAERSRYLASSLHGACWPHLRGPKKRKIQPVGCWRQVDFGRQWLPCHSLSRELLAYQSCYALLPAMGSAARLVRT